MDITKVRYLPEQLYYRKNKYEEYSLRVFLSQTENYTRQLLHLKTSVFSAL